MKKLVAINLNYLKLFVILFGSIVGAGFLTGAEIWQYFAKYGVYGYVYIFIVALLLYFYLYNILSGTNKIECFKKKNYAEKLLLFSNLLIASAMMSGLREIILLLFPNLFLIVFLLANLVIFYILYKGINKLFLIDLLVLFLVLFVIFNLNYNYKFDLHLTTISISLFDAFKGLGFCFLYFFMNIVSFYNTIEEIGIFFNKKNKIIFSIIFSIFVSFCLIFISTFLIKNADFSNNSMPLLSYFYCQNNLFSIFYSIGLVVSLLSTLIASLMCVKRRILISRNNLFSTFTVLIFSSVLSCFSFNFYVIFIYPFVGLISFILLMGRVFFNNN